jgi:hypothetical protein
LRRSCLLRHVIEGKRNGRIEVREHKEEDVNSYWMTLRQEKILELEGGSTRSHCVGNWLWKRLQTYYKSDSVVMTATFTADSVGF